MRKVVVCALFVLAVSVASFADTLVPPTFVDTLSTSYLGNRSSSSSSQIVATGGWINGDFQITWRITENNQTGNFHYLYTITTPASPTSNLLNYWILQVSNSFVCPPSFNINNVDPSCGNGVTLGTFSTAVGDIFGLRFDVAATRGTTTYEFDTPRAPVWGNFYADNGTGTGTNCPLCPQNYAYNAGFTQNPDTATSFLGFIARPDTVGVAEPASLILLCTGLMAAGAFRQRNLRR
jgi:hypothetical protein